jgi:hypothetical protein
MTPLKFLNYFILQWFFIRLARVVQDDVQIGWKILKGIIPMSGWNNDYKFISFL